MGQHVQPLSSSGMAHSQCVWTVQVHHAAWPRLPAPRDGAAPPGGLVGRGRGRAAAGGRGRGCCAHSCPLACSRVRALALAGHALLLAVFTAAALMC